MCRHFSWGALLLGSLLSLTVSYRLATQSLVLGSDDGHWVYSYVRVFSDRPLEVCGVVALFLVTLLVATTPLARREWTLVFAWCLIALGLQGMMRSLSPFTFGEIFISDAANSFYSTAVRYDAATILRGFERLRTGWPLHAQSNLPGKLLLVRALMHLTTRPGALAWLVVAISNMGGALLYIFVRDLLNDRRAALFSLALYLFMPAKLFFFPLLNTVTPVVVLGCACLWLRWILTGRTIYPAALGVSLYVLIIFEPTSLVVGVLLAALIATGWRTAIDQRRLALQTTIAWSTFAAAYSVMSFYFGFDLIHALRQVGAGAAHFNIEAGRPYSIWVRHNLFDFAFGVGLCQAVLFWVALAESLSGIIGSSDGLRQPTAVLCLALLATLLITDFIGINRGEVIRLWIFLACFFQVPAAYVCARLESRAALGVVLATSLLQGALGTAMVGFVVP